VDNSVDNYPKSVDNPVDNPVDNFSSYTRARRDLRLRSKTKI
jgi:hypothetical protein